MELVNKELTILLKAFLIGQRVESDAKIAGYISDWYKSQGYETQVQVFEYEET
jgi:hypothetical protein